MARADRGECIRGMHFTAKRASRRGMGQVAPGAAMLIPSSRADTGFEHRLQFIDRALYSHHRGTSRPLCSVAL